MTTLAYRDGVLASDSRMMQADTISAIYVPKVFRTSDCRLLGICGDLTECMRLVECLMRPERDRKGCDAPEMGASDRVVEVLSRTRIRLWEGRGSALLTTTRAAWGSGSPAALGAMYQGANARTAVKIAMKIDPYSGGPIRSVAL